MNTYKPPEVNQRTVRDAVSRFLRDRSAFTQTYVRREIRKSIRAVIDTIRDAGWDAYVVGGTIRDVVLGPRIVGPAAYYPRDIDIIVIGVTHDEIRKKFEPVYRRSTRFGGLHLVDQKPGGLKVLFDVWALDQTWAFKVQPVAVDISSFPLMPFLNLDTAAIEIQSRPGKARNFFENGFIDAINRRTLEINFEANPYPAICMVRALIMAAKLQFAIGPNLLEYILRQERTTSIDRLMTAQRSHYGFDRCSAEELVLWTKALQQVKIEGGHEGRIPVRSERQLELWNDYPAADPAEVQQDAGHLFGELLPA